MKFISIAEARNGRKKFNEIMKFNEVVGLQSVKDWLVRDADAGKIPHAQLFQGKPGSGVLPLAIAYAQYIHCEHPQNGDSCGVCRSCYQIARLEHPDLHFVFPVNKSVHAVGTSASGDLTSDSLMGKWREMVLDRSVPPGYFNERAWYDCIELGKNSQGNIARGEAAEITRKLGYKSFENGYKTVIIWMSERMNDTAANALLKLFEEPDENTLFLLLCEDSGTLLKTIVSRTRTVYVPPVEPSAMAEFLQERYGRENPLCLPVAKAAGGDVIRAVDLMETRGAGDENFEWFAEIMRRCFYTDHLGLIQWAENMASLPRESQKGFLEYALNMLRESFMYSLQMDTVSYAYGREADFLRKFSPYVHHKNMETLTEAFEKAALHIRQNGNPKIVWTHFALSISKQIYKL